MTTTYSCPICGQTITVHVALVDNPYCTHSGTGHDAHRPTVMIEEESPR